MDISFDCWKAHVVWTVKKYIRQFGLFKPKWWMYLLTVGKHMSINTSHFLMMMAVMMTMMMIVLMSTNKHWHVRVV